MKKIIIGLFTIGFLLVYGSTSPVITSMPSEDKIGSNGKVVTIRGVIFAASLDSIVNFKDDSGGVGFLTKSKIGNKIFLACKVEEYCEITGVINDYGFFTSVSNAKKIKEDSLTVGVEYYNAGIHMKDYTIKGNGEECRITYETMDNYLVNSTCLSLTNSKGIKIFCTKNKTICKTEQEIIDTREQEPIEEEMIEDSPNKSPTKTNIPYSPLKIKEIAEQESRGINKKLNLCVLYPRPKEIYTTSLALGNIANDNDIKINGDKIIITTYDIRSTKLADIIVQQVNFTSRPSCHKIWGIYIYRSDSYIRNADYFFQTLYGIFGFENVNGEKEPLDQKDILW